MSPKPPAVQIPRNASREVQQAIENLVRRLHMLETGSTASSSSGGTTITQTGAQQNLFIQASDPGTFAFPIFWIKLIGSPVTDF